MEKAKAHDRISITTEEFLDSSEVAVESARHDNEKGAWVIGVDFVRSWARVKSTASILIGRSEGIETRTIKILALSDETGEFLSYE